MRLHFVTHCLLLSTILTIGTKGETFHLLLSKSRELSSLKSGHKSLTTEPPNNIESEKLNVQIEHILYTSRTGHFIGNTEFDHQSAILRHAASLDSDFLHVKIREYYKFLSYNSLRLKLEADLQSRIAVTESYLQAEKIGDKCRAFYQNQKWELRRALNEPNFLKSHKLRLHSEKCPHKQTEDSEETEEDEDFCLFCTNWFPFKK
ncbi:uncharacterized protein LOC116805269 isoform X2 [Drosophila grimshawi]|uniref:uncharacterized protein LOC116805269 isoform X2 n=1 Tax=Drosophila grimshawi TaxID=7222 RepID=UPI000C86F345|nr:uncharacterized protein LOC116805269 isoform X2 [Drosophila grimshawi]